MTLKIVGSKVVDAAEALLAPLSGGPTPTDIGKIILYKGTRPALMTDTVPTGDIVVSYDIPREDAYEIGSTGTDIEAVFSNIAPKLAQAAGVVTFFRMVSWGTPVTIFEGDITDRAGNGELKISNTNILLGIYVRILSLKLKFPTVL